MIGTQTFCGGGAGATTELAVEAASDESLLAASFDNAGKGYAAITAQSCHTKAVSSQIGVVGEMIQRVKCV